MGVGGSKAKARTKQPNSPEQQQQQQQQQSLQQQQQPNGEINSNNQSEENIEHSRVFGVPLSVAAERSDPSGVVPAILRNSIEFLNERGLKEVGLYRIPGNKQTILNYRARFNRGDDVKFLEEEKSVAHRHEPADVAGLILLFLRELPESLFSDLYHEKFMLQRVPKEMRKQIVHNHIKLIPRCNRETLRILVQHLTKVAENEKINKMSIKNIVLCIWGTSPYTPVFFTLLENHEYIFSDTAGLYNSGIANNAYTSRKPAKVIASKKSEDADVDSEGNLDWLKKQMEASSTGNERVGKGRPMTISFDTYRLVENSSQSVNLTNRKSQRDLCVDPIELAKHNEEQSENGEPATANTGNVVNKEPTEDKASAANAEETTSAKSEPASKETTAAKSEQTANEAASTNTEQDVREVDAPKEVGALKEVDALKEESTPNETPAVTNEQTSNVISTEKSEQAINETASISTEPTVEKITTADSKSTTPNETATAKSEEAVDELATANNESTGNETVITNNESTTEKEIAAANSEPTGNEIASATSESSGNEIPKEDSKQNEEVTAE